MTAPHRRAPGAVGVALVGAGNISNEYLRVLGGFADIDVVAVTDLEVARARSQAEAFGVRRHGPPESAYDDPDVELVVNLTVPAVHAQVAQAAVAAGKHVWTEKPLAMNTDEARRLLAAADRAGVRVGGAPDTFLGPGLQNALRRAAAGDIGTPLTGLTLLQSDGPETWHPSPEFFYAPGAGPLFDMGPYYLTALVQAFGGVDRVLAVGGRARDERVIGSGPRAGTVFEVEVPTHLAALAHFSSGASSTSIFSFDSPLQRHGVVEITGTEATISFPDPNCFDGDVVLSPRGSTEVVTFPSDGPKVGRGVGVLEMARALREGRAHRASGELALHVLDTMVTLAASADGDHFLQVSSTTAPAPPLEEDWDPHAATLG